MNNDIYKLMLDLEIDTLKLNKQYMNDKISLVEFKVKTQAVARKMTEKIEDYIEMTGDKGEENFTALEDKMRDEANDMMAEMINDTNREDLL